LIPTIFLPIIMAIFAVIMMTRNKISGVFYLLVLSLVLGGTAIVQLPMLGGASVLVSHFVLFLTILVGFALLPQADIADAARIHWLAFVIAAYALLIGFFGPRLFAYGLEVFPMRMEGPGKVPLGPSSSNITHTLYFCGTLFLAVMVSALFRSRLQFEHLRNAVLALGAVHAVMGVIDFVAGTVGMTGLFDFFRNGQYAMVEQSVSGMKRAAGTFPEPAAYAALAVPLLVFCSELWLLRGDRLGGLVALMVLVGITLSTSSAGLLGIAAYVALLVVRVITSSHRPALFFRLLGMLSLFGSLTVIAGLLMVLSPDVFGNFDDAMGAVTLNKVGSDSANERSMWAMHGIELFLESYGFGVGAGSFRSSSVFTAWAGAFGLVGAILIPLYLLPVFLSPAGRSDRGSDVRIAGWAAIIALVPYAVVGVAPDPGLAFALFAGYAMADTRKRAAPVSDAAGLQPA
jgi:hypothetical protein